MFYVAEYSADVLEVISKRVAGDVGPILRVGKMGARDEIVDNKRNLSLVPGAENLIFVSYSPDAGMMTYSDFDVFRVDGPRVVANPYASGTQYGKTIVGRRSDEVVYLLKTAGLQTR